MALDQSGNLSSAARNYQKALHLVTDSSSEASILNPADIHLHLGGLYYRLHDYPKAVTHYRELLFLNPSHPQAEAVCSILLTLGKSF